MLFLIGTAFFNLAQPARIFYHHAAAFPAPLFEAPQGSFHSIASSQFIREYDAIFDAGSRRPGAG
jgi:hypothetical protein